MSQTYEELLSGGHPNSLGNTLLVVEAVLSDKSKLEELFNTYQSSDEVVRLRVSNALKRVCIEHPDWVYEYTDRLIAEIFPLNQASAQWTLAIVFRLMTPYLNETQKNAALSHFKQNLASHPDWIVINMTMETLFEWAQKDTSLENWLVPELKRFAKDTRKSVAGRAKKYLAQLTKTK